MRESNGENGAHRKHKTGTVVFRVIVILLLLAAVLLLLYQKAPALQNAQSAQSRERELSAQLGILPDMSDDEIQDALNRQVEEGMLNVSMNPLPIFKDGHSEGNVRIQNIAGNHYSIKVHYVRSDTGETILSTKYIDPGYYVDEIKLDHVLPRGKYLCVANVDAYAPDTLEPVGQTGMEVIITVEE